MVPIIGKTMLRLASASLLAAAAAYSQSLPTMKDWTGMTPAEHLSWASLKLMWNVDSMSAETRAEVERLNKQALTALAGGDHAASLMVVSHVVALLSRRGWAPEMAFSQSLTVEADRAVVGPGETFQIRLGQHYSPETPLKGPLQVTVSSQEGRNAPVALKSVEAANLDWRKTPLSIDVAAPACTTCRIVVAVLSDPPIQRAVTIRVQPGLAELKPRIDAAAKRLEALKSKSQLAAALPPLEYRLSLSDPAAVTEAEAALTTLEANGNPWAVRHGDFRMAYRSGADETLQPYRLFVPSSYDGTKPFPLILALHGAGRDENFYFDGVPNGQLKALAEKFGYLVACPRGRDPLSLYLGDGERDVLDVMAQVRKIYSVDPARIYLAGHSVGGAAVWSIAIHQPGVFAALAATAPAIFFLTPEDMAALKSVPQIVVQGDQDTSAPVKQTRLFTEAARKAGARVKYLEMSGAGHMDVVAPSLPEMFEWFENLRRPALAP